MAKKNELLNSFSSSRKQKNTLAADDIDRIAESVEAPPTPPSVKNAPPVVKPVVAKPVVVPVAVVVEEPQQEFVKTSLDFPVDVYEDMKIALFRKRRSMKDYIVELVRQDLYGKK